MPYPDYLSEKPKMIFFTDFDGTVTQEDMCDWLVETEGYGRERLRGSCQAVVDGKMNYRDASREQLESIRTPWEQCVEKVLAHVHLDEHFLDFYKWALSASIPIVVLSGGITSLIQATLEKLVGGEARGIEVVANSVIDRDNYLTNDTEGPWRVQFRDDSIFGNDKARAIRPYAAHRKNMSENEKPIILFAGDGVSDLSAAREADLLFAKKGEDLRMKSHHERLNDTRTPTDLVQYCKKQNIPFMEFQNWQKILKTTQDIYYNRKSVEEVAEEGRRASTTNAHKM